eukprot:TRINITY_DN827_c0_g1_i9.p2 TRINITY_DN827_c0_g1~~TRINITY_DN827_c0_g1_i9.p2  ORF type:complete len:162 (+),score=37.02 TRINITY_DN827_c0_g1_i9:141-626(+)
MSGGGGGTSLATWKAALTFAELISYAACALAGDDSASAPSHWWLRQLGAVAYDKPRSAADVKRKSVRSLIAAGLDPKKTNKVLPGAFFERLSHMLHDEHCESVLEACSGGVPGGSSGATSATAKKKVAAQHAALQPLLPTLRTHLTALRREVAQATPRSNQ